MTFGFPLITGTIIARFFGFSGNASLLIGSLLSSHTPLGYPILSQLGLMGNEAVMVTIGGTIFTNIPALLVLAVCVSVHAGSFSIVNLAIMLVLLTLYTGIVLFGFDWAGREFFRRSGDEEGNQFLFVLLAVFLAAVGAQIIGVEKIVGAFLAGMAVNGAMGSGPVKEKVVFVGSVLFIPIFMVNLGLLIDLPAFIVTLTSFWFTLAIISGLLISKLIASLGTQLLYRYTRAETLAIWSLSIPQVAATLAATIVGYNTLNPLGERLLSEEVLNTVIVMMLVTATLGPFLTARAAAGLTPPTTNLDAVKTPFDEENQPTGPFTVIVPVYNPETEKNLVEMAALLVRQEEGRIVPLSIARVMAQMEASAVDAALVRSEKLVAAAVQLSQEFGVKAEPAVRIDDDIAQGIAHASREQKASLIVMGWGETTTLRARLFGNVIDRLLWTAHCPVAVTRLRGSPLQMKRILVLVDNLVA
ncbi:MAG: cation:proton antiporter, partial [Chroococcales cyanobacterium]